MQNKELENRQENKKALPRFFLFLLAAMAVGFILGLVTALLGTVDIEEIRAALTGFWAASAPWMLPVFSILFLVPSTVLCLGQHKAFSRWDGEEETALAKIESRLSAALLLTGSFAIFLFFGLAVILASIERLSGGILLLCLAELVITLLWWALLQQKTIDLEKRINPEKHGSVYDMKFVKKWEDSCDEREKMIIYKSAYLAYRTTSRFCMGLAMLLMLGSIPFGYGPLPAGVVLLIWLVQMVRYCLAAMQMEKQ